MGSEVAPGVDPLVFLFLAWALKKGNKNVKELKARYSQKSRQGYQKTYPETRIIGGSVDITESPDVGGEFCKNYMSTIQAGYRRDPKRHEELLFIKYLVWFPFVRCW